MFKKSLESAMNPQLTLTENGAVTNTTTGSSLLNFFSVGGALRQRSEHDIVKLFIRAFNENSELALKMLFYFRDIRGGQGERKVFRTILFYMANSYPDIMRSLIQYIPEYGRWDDLFTLFETELEEDMITHVLEQLHKDINTASKEGSISLLAKWMPSLNASNQESRRFAGIFRRHLDWSPSMYKKNLSYLRSLLNVVEKKMSSNEWDTIAYSHVPSKASILYRKAFNRNDHARYQQYLSKVEKGESKINTAALYPYDLVSKVFAGDSTKTVDLAWNNLPDYFDGKEEDSIVVADCSGSMYSGILGQATPLHVAVSLAIYIAERNKGRFHNNFITFSDDPSFVTLRGKTIADKIKEVSKSKWGYSTNIEKVFMIILNTAIKEHLPQKDLPKRIYLISDMEFNDSSFKGNKNKTLFQDIKKKYKKAGYKCPELVFWNVNSRNTQFPMKMDDRGFLNVSGCSPSILKSLLKGDIKDAYDLMIQTITDDRYSLITVK